MSRDGICTLTDERPRLFYLKYKLLSLFGADRLLVCPYLTRVGSISGIPAVRVAKNMMERTS